MADNRFRCDRGAASAPDADRGDARKRSVVTKTAAQVVRC